MSGSYYQILQKYNQLYGLINALTADDLTAVLTAGDDAGEDADPAIAILRGLLQRT